MLNKIYSILILIVVLSCSSKPEVIQENSIPNSIISETIDAENFQRKMKNVEGAIILDVRTPAEVADGIIEGAINIDFRNDDFKSKIDQLDKDGTYFVYCARGSRSRNAADLMKELNFKEVYDLQGGFSQWKADGLPTRLP